MNTTSVHHDFNGYGTSSLSESEHLIRERLLDCLKGLMERNEQCLSKAHDQGREKLMSQILTVKVRIKRITEEMGRNQSGVEYRFDQITSSDDDALKKIESDIEALISDCGSIINDLTCSETDMHIMDRYVKIMENLGNIESLFHKRLMIFKKMQVYS